MKTNIYLELAKTIGFLALGSWAYQHFGNSFIYALPIACLGSAIVHFTYHLTNKEETDA